MAKADISSITTRRMLLGAIAVAPVLAAPPVEALQGDDPDAELLRLGIECIERLRDWGEVKDEALATASETSFWTALAQFRRLEAHTPAGLAMQLRVQFIDQCTAPWSTRAALAMELTEEQLGEIDRLDLALFRMAQTAQRISDGRAV